MSEKPRLGSLMFEVTQRCNHACLYCYNVWHGEPPGLQHPSPRGEMGTEQTLELLNKALDEMDCRHVTLTGGEPLLRPDLPAILGLLRSRGMHITIITNGRLLSEKRIVSLMGQGVGTFELPLLSHQREMHDRLCGARGAWDAVLAAMAHIRLQHGKAVTAFVATRLNIDHFYEVIRLAFAFGAGAVMLNRFNAGGRGRMQLQALMPSVEQVGEALQVGEAASVKLGIPIACSIPIQPCLIDTKTFPHIGFGYCGVGTDEAYYTLDPLGNLRPCNHSPSILGNLFEQPFSELISPGRLHDFMRAMPAACSHCGKRTFCQGGCKAAAEACYSSLEAEEPFLASAKGTASALSRNS